jgi:hypothetical protein
LEELADYFFRTIPGLIITGRRARKEKEEVDLYCNTNYGFKGDKISNSF